MKIGVMLVAGLIALCIVALFSVSVMYLWNWLVPEIFGLTEIDFWQALGLMILTRLLSYSDMSTDKK